jgi:hypothetical protein
MYMCTVVVGNIETMSLEMRIWPWIRDTQYEWMNVNSRLVYLAHIDVMSPLFQWYDEYVMTK